MSGQLSEVARVLLESEQFTEAFCANCPAVSILRGSRDCWGQKVEPDEDTCPAFFDPSDERCARKGDYDEFAENLEKELEELCRAA